MLVFFCVIVHFFVLSFFSFVGLFAGVILFKFKFEANKSANDPTFVGPTLDRQQILAQQLLGRLH